ncbi:MAG: TIGR04282 family arsenosugar biosynthesis glycosyltransferase [Nitrospirales bacterium]|nr:TIGR04282 family arsenosugar biosynthesis glycosyltransferase [Nitrospirales bacterium]
MNNAHTQRMNSRPRADDALVLFAKAPVPGQVKTRLCPPLTDDEAASLHGSFVLDALERSAQAAIRGVAKHAPRFDRFVACSPSSEHVFFKILEERNGVRLIDQMGDDLGGRMEHALAEMFRIGYQRSVIVGTDLPALPASVYDDAFGLLAQHDLVLGPSLDGGYYLIGLSRTAPEIFRQIPWSTPDVLTLTQTKAHALGLKVALLEPQRDVDTVDDVLALIHDAGLNNAQGVVSKSNKQKAPLLSKRTADALQLIGSRLKERGAGPTDRTIIPTP